MSRKVTIYNTIGNNKTVIETSAGVWGGLQEDLSRAGIHFSGMKAIVGETQGTLESNQAVLPEADFTLFLMPQKVKSGWNDEDGLIDWEDGITWDDEDWEFNNVEDFSFKTAKDLAIARAKRASFYLDKIIEYLTQEEKRSPSDPHIANLAATAEQIRKNMNLFD